MKWAYAGNWGDKGFTALFTFVLAGILGPREFGIVSIGMIYVSFLQMFLDQGLATALIQRKELKSEHLNAVFWVNLGLSLLLIVISLALANRWADANHAPEIALVVPLLSLSILFESLSIVQISVLKREMDFRSLTIRSNVSIVVSGAVGVGLAFAGFGVWALVVQQLLKDVSALLLLWTMSSWRPRVEFSWVHFKELLEFSIPNFIAKLGIFVDVQATSVAFGVLFGPKAVGLYRIAERVSGSVISMAMAAAQSVSLPEFARHQSDPARLRDTARTCMRLSATVTIPALAGLAIVSKPLMTIIGPEWAEATDVLQLLCILGIFMVFTFFTGPLLQAVGKTRELAALEWGRTAVGLVCLVITGYFVRHASERWQIDGIPLARLAAGILIITPYFVYRFLKLSRLALVDFLSALKPAAASAVGIVVAIVLLHLTNWQAGEKAFLRLSMDILVGAVVGIPILLFLDGQLRASVRALLRRFGFLRYDF